jgi:hypothetical protein
VRCPCSLQAWTDQYLPGRAGLGTSRPRTPSPPLPPTELHPTKLAKLADDTEAFRRSRGAEEERRRIESREWAARKVLIELDERKGVKVGAGLLLLRFK